MNYNWNLPTRSGPDARTPEEVSWWNDYGYPYYDLTQRLKLGMPIDYSGSFYKNVIDPKTQKPLSNLPPPVGIYAGNTATTAPTTPTMPSVPKPKSTPNKVGVAQPFGYSPYSFDQFAPYYSPVSPAWGTGDYFNFNALY